MTHIPPSFFIIGERKCGTSSLYRYLVAHPHVLPCKLKEPQFFSKPLAYIEQNIEEYFQLFPSREPEGDLQFIWPELNQEGILYHEEVRVKREAALQYYTGEASANTFHEVDPALLYRYLPKIKLIILLRDPVERAFSHHRMFQRFRDEGREFALQTGEFAADMEQEIRRFRQGKQSEFLSPGIYLHNLQKWESIYPSSQIKLLFARDLNVQPQSMMDELLSWLGFPPHDYGQLLQQRYNEAPPAQMPAHTRELLEAFYAPNNEALAQHLGRDLPW